MPLLMGRRLVKGRESGWRDLGWGHTITDVPPTRSTRLPSAHPIAARLPAFPPTGKRVGWRPDWPGMSSIPESGLDETREGRSGRVSRPRPPTGWSWATDLITSAHASRRRERANLLPLKAASFYSFERRRERNPPPIQLIFQSRSSTLLCDKSRAPTSSPFLSASAEPAAAQFDSDDST